MLTVQQKWQKKNWHIAWPWSSPWWGLSNMKTTRKKHNSYMHSIMQMTPLNACCSQIASAPLLTLFWPFHPFQFFLWKSIYCCDDCRFGGSRNIKFLLLPKHGHDYINHFCTSKLSKSMFNCNTKFANTYERQVPHWLSSWVGILPDRSLLSLSTKVSFLFIASNTNCTDLQQICPMLIVLY